MQLHLGWNSETGNTIDLLREFIDYCNTKGFAISSVQQLTEKIILHAGIWIFFVSTTGQGSPPHSMRLFWRQFMKKSYKLPHPIEFCVYSLGDSSYGDDFGMTARKFRQRLKMLGAVEIAQIGLGDDLDVQGYRQVYLSSWRDNVTKYLAQKLHMTTQKQYSERVTLRDRAKEIEFVIADVQELSERKSRKVYWVQLTLPENLAAKQGDTIEIYPHNRPEDVQYILKHLKRDPKTILEYDSKLITLKELLSQELNISSVLNYYFFANRQISKLVSTAKDPLYGRKIEQFITNYEEYFNYIKKYRRNITEFLLDFECQLDLDYLIRHINEVVGRKYSIARVQGNRAWLLVKLVEEEIAGTKFYRGVCSHDLIRSKGQARRAKLLEGDISPKQFRHSNIIIAMGTGIAPFIWALDGIEDRKYLLFYTNSYSDEIYHRMLVKSQGYEQMVSCTREGGPRMIRLLEEQRQKLMERIGGDANIRILYCGPKQIYQFIVSMVSQILGRSLQEVKRSKMIVYQNW